MQRTTKAMLSLGAILLCFGIMACQKAGLGKSEKKYAGTYVYKGENDLVKTLEIMPDGTFKLSTVSPYFPYLGEPDIFTGTWEISGEGKEEAIVFYPLTAVTPQPLIKKGDDLFSRFSGETFVKQAAAVQEEQQKSADKPRPRSRKSDVLATYLSQDKRKQQFIELRKDICFIGAVAKWRIGSVRGRDEYKIVLTVGNESDQGYLEGDTITGMQDMEPLVKQEGAELIKGGQGKLWSAYTNQKQEVLLRFKEDNTVEAGFLYKWERKGDVIRLYEKDKKEPEVEFTVKGKTLMTPEGEVFVKQD